MSWTRIPRARENSAWGQLVDEDRAEEEHRRQDGDPDRGSG